MLCYAVDIAGIEGAKVVSESCRLLDFSALVAQIMHKQELMNMEKNHAFRPACRKLGSSFCSKNLFVVASLAIVPTVLFSGPALSQSNGLTNDVRTLMEIRKLERDEAARTGKQKIDAHLFASHNNAEVSGVGGAQFARVQIESHEIFTPRLLNSIKKNGAQIEDAPPGQKQVLAKVPRSKLGDIAAIPEVSFIREPVGAALE
jgi:hypothetical protein